jgi:hypothetical protein
MPRLLEDTTSPGLLRARTLVTLVFVLAFAVRVPAQEAASSKPKPAGRPADFRSARFVLHTDLDQAKAEELLVRLETMLDLIATYWDRAPRGIIECYVVSDLSAWPDGSFNAHGRAKIQQGAGVTLTEKLTVGGQFAARSVVYATADRGTPQHEAVHAYCQQTFGETGPVWYSEGMAEMGQYWREGDASIHCDPLVIRYLQESPPMSLNAIVNGEAVTGDAWQSYAWRWALCHLLANNPNYATRFRVLGLGLLTGQRVSFEDTYGAMADEISFEYVFFLNHMDAGYRVDLTSWDWKKKFRALSGSAALTCPVQAARGWQPTSATLVESESYDFSAAGKWRTAKAGDEIDADGNEAGVGRLEGVILSGFELGEPFPLGSYGSFKAPQAGNLYVRCADEWNALADNDGKVTLKLKLSGQGRPLPKPKEE